MKESDAFRVMELTDSPTISHDDKLLLRGQKHVVGLTANWKHFVDVKYKDGRPVVVSYAMWGDDGTVLDHKSPEQWEELTDLQKPFYIPQVLKGLDLGGGASLVLRDNQFDLLLTDLFHDFGSRYRSALEAMVELVGRGVLRYEPRTEITERNMTEAIRNRLKRTVRPSVYEHDVLLRGELGKAVYDDLVESGKAKKVLPGSVYMTAVKPDKKVQTSIKAYDVGLRSGEEPGQRWKIEVSLLKGYFKSKGIGVAELTEQPDIQTLMFDRLAKDYAGVIKLLREETVEALQTELGLSGGRKERRHTDIAREILDRPRTLTDRVDSLERRMAAMEQRQERTEQRTERLEADRTSQNGAQ